ncbi:transglycosylase SLT domain-containing protein [Candidatus Aerophobetes bacterium]|nr:transglycosylase SLT domain-containing protein [Candidatus Aerophobetes bacterium]
MSEIAKASQKTGIPLSTLASLAKRESQFDPQAVSRKGAYGLMGVTFWAYRDVLRLRKRYRWMDEALEEYGEISWDEVKSDPELNLVVGAIYYRFLLEEFEDPFLASLAYNWGMGNVYLMLEKYEDKEIILYRLKQMASLNKAWAEPADYPEYISIFEKTFQKVEEKIRLVYAGYKEISQTNLAFLFSDEKVPSS